MTEEPTAHLNFAARGLETILADDSIPTHELQVSEISEKYRLVRSLGRGGMGEVFEAVHVHTSRRVAVKLLHANGGSGTLDETRERQTRFAREAQIIGQIRSPHVVEVFDAGVTGPDNESAYIAMELMHGEDFSAILNRVGPLPVETVLKVAVQAARGLAKAHEVGVVHRDIKPANLFLMNDGTRRVVKILDFGVARITAQSPGVDLTQDLTHTGTVIGSPAYMAPEQVRGRRDLDHRADVWSLCAALYKLLCGRTPHTLADNGIGELLVDICSKPAEPVRAYAAWVPTRVSDAVMRGLSIDVNERYGSMDSLLKAFLALLGESGEVLDESDIRALDEQEKRAIRGALSRTRRRSRKQRPIAYAIGALAATIAGVGAAGISVANAKGFLDPLQAPRTPLSDSVLTSSLVSVETPLATTPQTQDAHVKHVKHVNEPTCAAAEESIMGRCVAKCPEGHKRARGGLECLAPWGN